MPFLVDNRGRYSVRLRRHSETVSCHLQVKSPLGATPARTGHLFAVKMTKISIDMVVIDK